MYERQKTFYETDQSESITLVGCVEEEISSNEFNSHKQVTFNGFREDAWEWLRVLDQLCQLCR